MSQVKIQGMKINTKELDEPLASQLQKIVVDSALTNFKTPKPERKNIELSVSSMDQTWKTTKTTESVLYSVTHVIGGYTTTVKD